MAGRGSKTKQCLMHPTSSVAHNLTGTPGICSCLTLVQGLCCRHTCSHDEAPRVDPDRAGLRSAADRVLARPATADAAFTQAVLPCAGGHTAEMLALTARLDRERYSPRCYVVAATDRMGAAKAEAAEAGQVRQRHSRQTCGPRPQASCTGCARRPQCARFHAAARLGSRMSHPCGPRWWRCAQRSPLCFCSSRSW